MSGLEPPRAETRTSGVALRRSVRRALSLFERRVLGFRSFGANSVIWPFPKKIIGARFISVGDECFFAAGLYLSVIEEYAGRRFVPELRVGSRCMFGSNFTVSCTHRIVIGDGVLASDRVFVGDSIHGYEDPGTAIRDQPMAGEESVEIGEGSFLGIGSVILPGVRLGRGCVVGANAVVTRTFADYTVLGGVPAKPIRRFCAETQRWERAHDMDEL